MSENIILAIIGVLGGIITAWIGSNRPPPSFLKSLSKKFTILIYGVLGAIIGVGLSLGAFIIIPVIKSSTPTPTATPTSAFIEIVEPSDGSTVSHQVNIKGRHNLPIDSHIWLFYRYTGEQKYYPSGEGPVTLQVNGNWYGVIYVGEESGINSQEEFVIIVALTDDSAHQELEQYIEAENWVSIDLPDGTSPYDNVTVIRKR